MAGLTTRRVLLYNLIMLRCLSTDFEGLCGWCVGRRYPFLFCFPLLCVTSLCRWLGFLAFHFCLIAHYRGHLFAFFFFLLFSSIRFFFFLLFSSVPLLTAIALLTFLTALAHSCIVLGANARSLSPPSLLLAFYTYIHHQCN